MKWYITKTMKDGLQVLEIVSNETMNPRSSAAMDKIGNWIKQVGSNELHILQEIPIKVGVCCQAMEDKK